MPATLESARDFMELRVLKPLRSKLKTLRIVLETVWRVLETLWRVLETPWRLLQSLWENIAHSLELTRDDGHWYKLSGEC